MPVEFEPCHLPLVQQKDADGKEHVVADNNGEILSIYPGEMWNDGIVIVRDDEGNVILKQYSYCFEW